MVGGLASIDADKAVVAGGVDVVAASACCGCSGPGGTSSGDEGDETEEDIMVCLSGGETPAWRLARNPAAAAAATRPVELRGSGGHARG